MNCRPHCGACCTAPSISTPIPDPLGGPARPKAAGVPCVQLDADLRCQLFGKPERPAVCASLRPHWDMCGATQAEAVHTLSRLEWLTAPDHH